ncbi:hypothetical protein CVV26_03250 [Candidatus Kuenenbacteria bacterium HGW-Kuenenbacteria-1]|uniref:ATPase n=1 Tax=Candidatus Kuenenbacteria bacterium HGW-Kuenenbacteria-1 TaxID=2013812 RepID=A0A2N1UMW3_9BACT|nr:MAG: hypothetical protein CVV26_03250 [Candidatus Kuenenbacteria bacterium HGW-Kuenenbacteria-1]
MSILRNITNQAKKYLDNDQIMLFIGPRQAGKTTILKQLQDFLKQTGQETFFLNLEDPDYLDLLNRSPKNLFKIISLNLTKKSFVFIDEIQYLKNPSNFLKYFYDEYNGKIKILASGSSAFYLDTKFKDSLAGRKKIYNVLTLSFKEFLRFKNEEDLSKKDFFNLTLSEKEKIILYFQEYITYGGYPRVVLSSIEDKIDILRDIAYSYIKKDIFEANIKQEEVFYKLFKILSSQIGSLVNASELSVTLGVSKTTIDHYFYVMQKSFHLKLISPFFKNVRKELTKMPKVYFLDLGLRNFFSNNFKTFYEREDKGVFLENITFRQLLENYDIDEIKFWRTIQKQEIDFVIKDNLALEIKVQPKLFKKNKYKIFLDNYPEIKVIIVVFDSLDKIIEHFRIINVWQIEQGI